MTYRSGQLPRPRKLTRLTRWEPVFPMMSGCNGWNTHAELATPVAWRVPLPEALMSSVSPSLVLLSRVMRERLFCPEAEGEVSSV